MFFSFVLNVRTMHSSALRALECIGWGRGATGHSDTSAAETGAAETSERERSHDFNRQRVKSKLDKLMTKALFVEIELFRCEF